MKQIVKSNTVLFILIISIMVISSGCSKRVGCPSNGKNVGAERLFGNEKLPKVKKFKA